MCIFISVTVRVSAEEIYKKTSPDGSVEFTDRKSKDSEKIKISEPSTYTAPVLQNLPGLNLPKKKLSPTVNYTIKIVQPVEDETITNTNEVVVSVLVEPAFAKGYPHQIRYQLGDQTVRSKETRVTFKNVVRGTHSLNVSIVDSNDVEVSPVTSVKFHLKRFFKKTLPAVTPPK
jgi:hypothetical protein